MKKQVVVLWLLQLLCATQVVMSQQQPFEMIVYSPKNPVIPAQGSKHIVVVIASYNNASYYKINLDSVLCQNYDNFEVIITDDKSPDGTGKLIQDYLDSLEVRCKVTLIRNHIRGGALQNTYRPISWAKDDAIIACVDGDDALKHPGVLSLINETYAHADVWMTHGRLQLWNGDAWDYQQPIPTHVIRSHSFRSYPRIVSHLRTFYAGLFRSIKLKDLLYEGAFLGAAPDVAWTIPMMEMSGFHHVYIKDILYRYNDDTPLNEFRVSRDLQLGLERFIRSKQPYAPLEQLQLDAKLEPTALDLLLYQDRAGDDIQHALAQALSYIQPVDRVFVVSKDDVQPAMIDNLAQQYKDIAFYCFSDAQVKRTIMRYIYSHNDDHGYVVFIPTSCTLHEPIDMQAALQKLRNTHAYGFCCDRIHKKISDKYCLDVDGVTYAHEIAHALQQGITPADLRFVVYKKNSIADICKSVSYDSIEQLQDQLVMLCDQTDVMLFNR